MTSTLDRLCARETAYRSARSIAAYLACDDETRAGIRDMLAVIDRPESSDDECGMAASTIMESLTIGAEPIEGFDAAQVLR